MGACSFMLLMFLHLHVFIQTIYCWLVAATQGKNSTSEVKVILLMHSWMSGKAGSALICPKIALDLFEVCTLSESFMLLDVAILLWRHINTAQFCVFNERIHTNKNMLSLKGSLLFFHLLWLHLDWKRKQRIWGRDADSVKDLKIWSTPKAECVLGKWNMVKSQICFKWFTSLIVLKIFLFALNETVRRKSKFVCTSVKIKESWVAY